MSKQTTLSAVNPTFWLENASLEQLRSSVNYTMSGISIVIDLKELEADKVTSLMMVTIENSGMRYTALSPDKFKTVMRIIERRLLDLMRRMDVDNPYYFKSFSQSNSIRKWYSRLSCHRIFFIPTSNAIDVFASICDSFTVELLKGRDVDEVFFHVKNSKYDFSVRL